MRRKRHVTTIRERVKLPIDAGIRSDLITNEKTENAFLSFWERNKKNSSGLGDTLKKKQNFVPKIGIQKISACHLFKRQISSFLFPSIVKKKNNIVSQEKNKYCCAFHSKTLIKRREHWSVKSLEVSLGIWNPDLISELSWIKSTIFRPDPWFTLIRRPKRRPFQRKSWSSLLLF